MARRDYSRNVIRSTDKQGNLQGAGFRFPVSRPVPNMLLGTVAAVALIVGGLALAMGLLGLVVRDFQPMAGPTLTFGVIVFGAGWAARYAPRAWLWQDRAVVLSTDGRGFETKPGQPVDGKLEFSPEPFTWSDMENIQLFALPLFGAKGGAVGGFLKHGASATPYDGGGIYDVRALFHDGGTMNLWSGVHGETNARAIVTAMMKALYDVREASGRGTTITID